MSIEIPSKCHSLNICWMKCKLFQFYNYSYQYWKWRGLHVSQYFNKSISKKSRDITLPTKVHLVKGMVFPVVMYGCESWTIKEAEHRRIDAFELWCWRILESPLDCKEIQPVHPKGDQSWVFIGGTDVEAETPILQPPDAESWLIGKDPDAGKDWGQEEKGTTEDEMVGWHHRLNGHGFGWTPGVGDGQGGLACCGSWGHKQLDTTERLNWTKLMGQNLLNINLSSICGVGGEDLSPQSRQK